MAAEIFIDTGAWLALADLRDAHHVRAAQVYPTLLRTYADLVTTNLVLAESYTLIRRRLGHPAGMRFLAGVRRSPRVRRIYSDGDLELEAEAILRQFADQDFTFTDAVSFVVMRAQGIAEAFAFDRHYRAAGFGLVPALESD